jgi:hypothetical protein
LLTVGKVTESEEDTNLGFEDRRKVCSLLIPKSQSGKEPTTTGQLLSEQHFNPRLQPSYDRYASDEVRFDVCGFCGSSASGRIKRVCTSSAPELRVIECPLAAERPEPDKVQQERNDAKKSIPPSLRDLIQPMKVQRSSGATSSNATGRIPFDPNPPSRSTPFVIDWEVKYSGLYQYELFGVIYYVGEYTRGGHYVCRYRHGATVFHYDGLKTQTITEVGTAFTSDDQQRLIPHKLDDKTMSKPAVLFYSRVY